MVRVRSAFQHCAIAAALCLAAFSSTPEPKDSNTDGTDAGGAPVEAALTWTVEPGYILVPAWPSELTVDSLVLKRGSDEVTLAVKPDTPLEIDGPLQLSKGEGTWMLKNGEEVVGEGAVTFGDRWTTFYDDQLEGGATFSDQPLYAKKGATKTYKGIAGANGAKPTAYIGTPSGPVDTVALGDGKLSAGEAFEFDVTFDEAGMYVIEINDTTSLPTANFAVYVGVIPASVPALDLPGSVPFDGSAAQQFYDQINALRVAHGEPELTTHDGLAGVAQLAAEEMASSGVWGHYGCDFFKSEGLAGTCSENIGGAESVDTLVLGWYFSPSHRRAIIDSRWSTQGFGLKDDGGFVLCAHIFSDM